MCVTAKHKILNRRVRVRDNGQKKAKYITMIRVDGLNNNSLKSTHVEITSESSQRDGNGTAGILMNVSVYVNVNKNFYYFKYILMVTIKN